MNKLIKSLLIVALCTTMVSSAWSQASTEGKEFWLSSSLVCSPDKKTPTPYIAVSAEKACTVTIEGGVGGAINIVQQVAAGSWNEFGNNAKPEQKNPNAGLINVHMDASKWYPVAMTNANSVSTLAAQKNMYGLHITATENISVYVILSSLHSMDASNILPMTALGSEYYTQDYWSKVKSDFNDAVGLTTILGTEDNTVIDITPNGDTFDGWTSGTTHQITLNKGQTYYLVTKKGERLSGTHIMARNGKKIAIYCGVPITNVPTNIAARDCLFEQSMPIEYWGTQFIATRSLEKNGNLIGITATQPSTWIKVDGNKVATINEGDTYYIMLQGPSDANAKNPGTSPIDLVLTQDVAYIETKCPCAVYSYDTGNSYKGQTGDEVVGGKGDPSSVWVSPIQQKINKITFGTCYTDKTKDHFLNVVTETATCQNTKLTAIYGITQFDKTSLLVWAPVPGNPTYSYARAKIGDASTSQFSVFRLENAKGFTATIYGNGEDESYAYSAGSAAVEQGINVNGVTFTDGYRSDEKFCIADAAVEFDAAVGTDEIERVDWDFGDGTTDYNGPVKTTHQYTAPGWYDVSAVLYGHQVCTEELDQFLGSVSFTFRFVRQDTIVVDPMHKCLPVDTLLDNPAERARLLSEGDISYDPVENCYDTVHMHMVVWGEDREETLPDITANDSAFAFGKWFDKTQTYDTIIMNETGCETHRKCNIKVITCLRMDVETDPAKLHSCAGEKFMLPYTKQKGDISESGARLIIVPASCPDPLSDDNNLCAPLVDRTITWSDMNHEAGGVGTIDLPTEDFKPGLYKAVLIVTDGNCPDADGNPIQLTFVRTIAVDYPKDIIVHKLFNNVLAVLNAAHNGGYQFVAFQWYRNGELIPGATGAVYHSDEPLNNGDQYHVEVTDINGTTLPSCDKQISGMPDEPQIDDEPNAAPAQKLLQGNQMVIRLDGHIFNIFGQRVQ